MVSFEITLIYIVSEDEGWRAPTEANKWWTHTLDVCTPNIIGWKLKLYSATWYFKLIVFTIVINETIPNNLAHETPLIVMYNVIWHNYMPPEINQNGTVSTHGPRASKVSASWQRDRNKSSRKRTKSVVKVSKDTVFVEHFYLRWQRCMRSPRLFLLRYSIFFSYTLYQ